jgi:hypothetical protein
MRSRIGSLLLLFGIGGLIGLAVSACHGNGSVSTAASAHPSVSAAVHSAKAQASALATNPATLHDEVLALRKLSGCVNTATGGQLQFKVVTGGQGSASIPGTTSPPTVQVTHWSIGLFHHLILKTDAAVNCAAPPSVRASAKKCIKHLSLPLSHEAINQYLIAVANCTVGAPQ